jgi:hypothetical protein
MTQVAELIDAVERTGEQYAEFIEAQTLEAFHFRPGPDEWSAAEITGHVAEFPATFSEQARRLSEQPGLQLGRSLDDPGRVEAVKKLAGAEPLEAAALVRSTVQSALGSLQSIEPAGWQVKGQHRTYGEMTVQQIVQRFVADHLRTHLEQARAAVAAAGGETSRQ